jgi:DNA polymerase III epsilon subunit-like protein
MDIYFLDTETTGFVDGRLLQLAFKKRGGSDIVCEFYNPPVPIEVEAMEVHGITEKMVADKPAFEESESFRVLPGLLAKGILVAHNAAFDVGVLEGEGIPVGEQICTMKVTRARYDTPNHRLQYLRYLWGIELDEAFAHDAKGDVLVLEAIFERMLREAMEEYGESEEQAIARFIDITKKPVLLRRLSFGKYAGKSFADIVKGDRGYMEWLATLSDKDEDFKYTVAYHLGRLGKENGQEVHV